MPQLNERTLCCNSYDYFRYKTNFWQLKTKNNLQTGQNRREKVPLTIFVNLLKNLKEISSKIAEWLEFCLLHSNKKDYDYRDFYDGDYVDFEIIFPVI